MKIPKITDSRMLKEGRFLHLQELELTHPNGRRSIYEVAKRNAEKVFWIVTILPVTQEGDIILIRQYRAPLDRIQLELPAGLAEVGKHTSLEEAVHSELFEETGYKSDKLTHIAEFSSSSGMTNETVHWYIAHNCKKVTDILTLDESEYIERIKVSYSWLQKLILDEIAQWHIIDPKMIAIIWLYLKNRKK